MEHHGEAGTAHTASLDEWGGDASINPYDEHSPSVPVVQPPAVKRPEEDVASNILDMSSCGKMSSQHAAADAAVEGPPRMRGTLAPGSEVIFIDLKVRRLRGLSGRVLAFHEGRMKYQIAMKDGQQVWMHPQNVAKVGSKAHERWEIEWEAEMDFKR